MFLQHWEGTRSYFGGFLTAASHITLKKRDDHSRKSTLVGIRRQKWDVRWGKMLWARLRAVNKAALLPVLCVFKGSLIGCLRGGNDHDMTVMWAGLSTINREANQPLQSRLCQNKRHSAGAIQLWHRLSTLFTWSRWSGRLNQPPCGLECSSLISHSTVESTRFLCLTNSWGQCLGTINYTQPVRTSTVWSVM